MNKEKLLSWIKGHENLLWAVVMSLLPLICCAATCAFQGQRLSSVYLPASEWNDELFYFKQVEGIVNYGYPQGYFGFNESHARQLSFAAWSPVLVWPWILWGLVFGWNLQSPVICNIVLMMITMFGFVRLVKPDRKQLGVLTLLFVSFNRDFGPKLFVFNICFCLPLYQIGFLHGHHLLVLRGLNCCRNLVEEGTPFP